MRSRAFLLLIGSLWLTGAAAAQSQKEIAEIVARLVGEDPKERALALDALSGYGVEALPAVARVLAREPRTLPIAQLLEAIHRQANAAPPPSAIESYFAEQLVLARGMLKSGDASGALSVLEALVTLAPAGATREDAVRLRRDARDKLAELEVAAGTLVTAGDRFGLDELIEVQVRIENRSEAELVIPLAKTVAGIKAETLLLARVVYKIYDPSGNMRSHSERMQVELEGDIRIAPRSFWTTSFLIDPAAQHRGVTAVRTYEVSAELRPAEIQTTAAIRQRAINFPAITLTVFPLGWEQVASDTPRYMQEFLRGGRVHELAVAAWLVSSESAPAATELLIDGLVSGDPALSEACMAALERITGRQPGRDVQAWIHWWQARTDPK